MQWMFLPYKRYFEFSGRSRRLEYWWFAVFTSVIVVVLTIAAVGLAFDILQQIGGGDLSAEAISRIGGGAWGLIALVGVFILVSIIPGIAVQVRRLHDLGVSGWWYLAYIVSGVVVPEIPTAGEGLNALVTLGWIVWMFFPGTRGPNKYGDDPKDPVGAAGVFA